MARDILISPAINIGVPGIAGVWAEENTREAIFAALQRKETFATSGTRISLRLPVGDFADMRLNQPDLVKTAYQKAFPWAVIYPPMMGVSHYFGLGRCRPEHQ